MSRVSGDRRNLKREFENVHFYQRPVGQPSCRAVPLGQGKVYRNAYFNTPSLHRNLPGEIENSTLNLQRKETFPFQSEARVEECSIPNEEN